jgi:transposase
MPAKGGISYNKKAEIIKELNGDTLHRHIAQKYGVSRSFVSRLNNPVMKAAILSFVNSARFGAKKSRKQKAKYVQIEEELLDWIMKKKANNKSLRHFYAIDIYGILGFKFYTVTI